MTDQAAARRLAPKPEGAKRICRRGTTKGGFGCVRWPDSNPVFCGNTIQYEYKPAYQRELAASGP